MCLWGKILSFSYLCLLTVLNLFKIKAPGPNFSEFSNTLQMQAEGAPSFSQGESDITFPSMYEAQVVPLAFWQTEGWGWHLHITPPRKDAVSGPRYGHDAPSSHAAPVPLWLYRYPSFFSSTTPSCIWLICRKGGCLMVPK